MEICEEWIGEANFILHAAQLHGFVDLFYPTLAEARFFKCIMHIIISFCLSSFVIRVPLQCTAFECKKRDRLIIKEVVAQVMEPSPEVDHQTYKLAKCYLSSLGIQGITAEVIETYLVPDSRATSKEEIYRRILHSAMMAGAKLQVIEERIGNFDNLKVILEGFDPKAVLARYGGNREEILNQIEKNFKFERPICKKTPRSIWPQYCRTILSSAKFINQFTSVNEFYRWFDSFDKDDLARERLPKLLSREIDGFGFALACELLSEIGLPNFPKPDVHLRNIFTALELCPEGCDDYQLFKAIVRLANNSNVTPFNAGKVFWLIGSGHFYNDPMIGDIHSHKDDFIEYASRELKKMSA